MADEHKPGVLAIERMKVGGVFDRVDEWFPIVRPRGHGVVSLFAGATLFLSAGPNGGIRPYFERMNRRTRRRLGALVGVRSLPTAGSISRALTRFEHVKVRSFVSSLLASSIDKEMLHHPAVLDHDALGDGWHTLDLDPEIKPVCFRDIPKGDDLPEGKRRAKGQPGYLGRKRGNARMRTIPVIHDGTGMWLSMVLVPEEGSIVPYCQHLMQSAMATIAEHGHADRVIARGDCELGSAGALRAIIDSGAHPLVRLSRYQLLDREEVAAHLHRVSWCPTRPGESGLQREAAELGTFTLRGVTDSEDEAVVTVRVVVTRFPRTSEPDHGVMRDGYQLELFATTLDPVRWPAPDVVERYGGRATIENRLAQEDREFNLGRNFTFHPAGQEWMCGVGLYLWNEQVRAGWLANPPPAEPPVQAARPPLDALSRPVLGGVQACLNEVREVEAVTEVEVEAEASPVADIADVEGDGQPPVAQPGDDGGQPPVPVDVGQARAALSELVNRVYADVSAWPGWRVEAGQLRCPEKRRLFPYSAVGASKAGAPRLIVRTEPWACNGCPVRTTCFPGRGPYKQIARTVDEADLEIATLAMGTSKKKTPTRPRPKPHRVQPAAEPTTHRDRPVFAAPNADVAGPLYSEGPRFLPSAARRIVRDYARDIDIILRVGSPKQRRPPPPHPLVATSAADRAHRRLTRRQVRARELVELHTRLLKSIRARSTGKSATT